jgi:hypothetical protein
VSIATFLGKSMPLVYSMMSKLTHGSVGEAGWEIESLISLDHIPISTGWCRCHTVIKHSRGLGTRTRRDVPRSLIMYRGGCSSRAGDPARLFGQMVTVIHVLGDSVSSIRLVH